MTFKHYKIASNKLENYGGIIDYICSHHAKALYGIKICGNNWMTDYDYINTALLENDEFLADAKTLDDSINFDRYEPYEVYQKLVNDDIDYIVSEKFSHYDELNIVLESYINTLNKQINDLDEYLTNNVNIEILESDVDNEYGIFNYIVEFDDTLLDDVSNVLNTTNKKAEAANDIVIKHTYCEKHYNIPLFGVEFSNPGSLEIEINEIN